MVFFSCTSSSCPFVMSVQATDDAEAAALIGPESDWYPDQYPCPICGERCVCSTKLLDERRMQLSLTPQEAFIAFAGGGLPDEQECSAAAVEKLLSGAQVKGVCARHIQGTNRCTIDYLELEGGVRMYLGSSVHGACVYRVQGPQSYAGRVHD